MTIYGWDMSHYDSVPTAAQVSAAGIEFVTHKAGGDAADAELAPYWNAFKDHRDKILPGAYWVLLPGSGAAEADRFLAQLDPQCPGWRDEPFILQADCETWPGHLKPGLAEIEAFCDRLKARAPKLTPIVYASRGQYGNALAGLRYPLWNANYPSSLAASPQTIYAHVGADSGVGWGAYSGQVPAIWQYSSKAVIAGQTTSDANAYRGTLAELSDLTSPGWSANVSTSVWSEDVIPVQGGATTWTAGGTLGQVYDNGVETRNAIRDEIKPDVATLVAGVTALTTKVDQLLAAVATLSGANDVTPTMLQAAIVAALVELGKSAPPAWGDERVFVADPHT